MLLCHTNKLCASISASNQWKQWLVHFITNCDGPRDLRLRVKKKIPKRRHPSLSPMFAKKDGERIADFVRATRQMTDAGRPFARDATVVACVSQKAGRSNP